jgi:hypothetical protein
VKWQLHAFRGLSGHFELGRMLWALSTLGLIAYQGLAIWLNHQSFSPTEFGLGAASILAAGGFGIAVKDKGVASAQTAGGAE